jgi:hypothetical protein
MRDETNRETVTAKGAVLKIFLNIMSFKKNADRVTNSACCHANQSHELESVHVWGGEGVFCLFCFGSLYA